MALTLTDTIKQERRMEMGLTFGLTAASTQGSGLTTRSMER
jgi:hypothetical protein